METKHCPFCNETKLLYEIDIFKKRNEEGYYKGGVECEKCRKKFKDIAIVTRHWKECGISEQEEPE